MKEFLDLFPIQDHCSWNKDHVNLHIFQYCNITKEDNISKLDFPDLWFSIDHTWFKMQPRDYISTVFTIYIYIIYI